MMMMMIMYSMSNERDEDCQTLRFHDWIIIICTATCILVTLFIILAVTVLIFTRKKGRKSARKRGSSCVYCDGDDYDPERQPLLYDHQHIKNNHHPEMKRTPTYYQWNKPSFPRQYENLSPLPLPLMTGRRGSNSSTEHCWHQRREALLRRFAAA